MTLEEEEFYEDEDLLDDDEDDGVDETDIEVSRMITIPPVDIEPLAKAMESLQTQSPLERSLISYLQELHQLLGDADAHLADRLADTESAIRLHFMEFNKAPGTVLLGVLASMPPEEQLAQIDEIRLLLRSRYERCERAIAQRVESGGTA